MFLIILLKKHYFMRFIKSLFSKPFLRLKKIEFSNPKIIFFKTKYQIIIHFQISLYINLGDDIIDYDRLFDQLLININPIKN